MTPDQQRKFNTILGGLFIALGILAWFMSFYFGFVPNKDAPAPVIGAATVDINSCRAALSELGYSVTAKEHEVTAFEALQPDPKEQLERASTAVLVCKLKMFTFCMGEGCQRPGLTFTVRRPVDSTGFDGDVPAPSAAPASAAASKPKKAPSK